MWCLFWEKPSQKINTPKPFYKTGTPTVKSVFQSLQILLQKLDYVKASVQSNAFDEEE